MSEQQGPAPVISAEHHPMVMATVARLVARDEWVGVLEGELPSDPISLAGVEVLRTAGVLAPRGSATDPCRADSWHGDPEALSRGMLSELTRAVRYAVGGNEGWHGEDAEQVLAQGWGSALAAEFMIDFLIPQMPQVVAEFARARGRFLDVGTGIGKVSRAVCSRYPGVTALGIDVLDQVLRMARSDLYGSGVADRVTLRRQSVADLSETEMFDLAWLPQPFIPPDIFEHGVYSVAKALKPGAWIVVPAMAPLAEGTDLDHALYGLNAQLLGGGVSTNGDVTALLERAGFSAIQQALSGPQTLLFAQRD